MPRDRFRGEERGRKVAGEWVSWRKRRREVGPDHPSCDSLLQAAKRCLLPALQTRGWAARQRAGETLTGARTMEKVKHQCPRS